MKKLMIGLIIALLFVSGVSAIVFEFIPSSEVLPSYLDSLEDIESGWGPEVELKAYVLDTHFNLNQPARIYDSLADDWTFIFYPDVPILDSDRIYFCGPESNVWVEIRNSESLEFYWQGWVTGVEPCV